MAETVIQSFLAELGFKVEQQTLDAFNKSLKSSSVEAVAFGNMWADVAGEAVKGANAIVASVFQMAAQFDQLYFASRRVGDTAENLQEAGYAFKQMGGNAQEAQQAIESLQSFIARTPGAISLLHNLGVQVINPATGRQYSPTELMQQTQKTLHDLFLRNPALALSEGGMIGMSERLIRMDPQEYAEAIAEVEEIRKHFKLTGDEATVAGHKFEHAWTRLKETAGDAFESIIDDWMPDLTKSMDGLSEALEGKWSQAWQEWGKAAQIESYSEQYEADVEAARRHEISYAELERRRTQYRAAIDKPVTIEPGAAGEPDVPTLMAPIQDTPAKLRATEMQGLQAQAQAHAKAAQEAARLAGDPTQTARFRHLSLLKAQDEIAAANLASKSALALAAKPVGEAPAAPDAGAAAGGADAGAVDIGPTPQVARGGTRRQRSASQMAYSHWLEAAMLKRGASPAAAKAIAMGAYAEAGHPGAINPTSGAIGTGQWLGDRKAIYEAFIKAHGGVATPDLDADYIWWEMHNREKAAGSRVLGAKTAEEGAWAYIKGYMRPDPAGTGDVVSHQEFDRAQDYLTSQSASNAAAGVHMSQKTDINIHGVSDPTAAAQAVQAAQNRVNWQLRDSLLHLA